MIPDFPTTRSEAYLAKICGEDAEIPEPQTRTDLFLAAIAGADVTTPEPRTRSEIFLASILGQSVELPAPQSRMEFFLAKIAGLDVETPEPQTRLEMYLSEWAQGGGEEYETVGPTSVATFTTLRAAPLKELLVNIDPVQSGSGDPAPDNVRPISGWDGVDVYAAGKNLYDRSCFNKSGNYMQFNGIHTPSTSDGEKRARGIYLKGGQTYRIYIDFGATKQFGVYAARTGYTSQIQIASNSSRSKYDATYTPTYDGWYCFWLYSSGGWSGYDVDDVIFQIYLGDVEFMQAEPSTKRNISIPFATGTNLYDRTRDGLEQGSITGSYVDVDNDYRLRTGYIAVSPSTSYTINSNLYLDVYEYSSQSSSGGVAQGGWNAPYRTITTGASTAYIRVILCKDLLMSTGKVTPADFEFLTIQTPPGEVFGGTLNVTTGVLTVTMANIASYAGESINEPWVSSMDKYVSGATPTTGAQVVYSLAVPVTYQLTPEEVTALLGANNIWADAGDVTVTYQSN